MAKNFSVSGQHYLFNVQTFAHTVLALGGDEYAYSFRDGTTAAVIDDVARGVSELGVLFQTSATSDEVSAALGGGGSRMARGDSIGSARGHSVEPSFGERLVAFPRCAGGLSVPLLRSGRCPCGVCRRGSR